MFHLLTRGLWYFVKRNRWNFLVIFALVGISGLGLYQSALENLGTDNAWWSGLWQNFATEIVGAILTFAIFEMLINANNRQEELIRQMASHDNATASNAINELRALGYLFDGTLRRKSFVSAKFAGANLSHADLSDCQFNKADLSDADLSGANLKGANLQSANLNNTILKDTHFSSQTIMPDGHYWSAQKPLKDALKIQLRRDALRVHPYRIMRNKRHYKK